MTLELTYLLYTIVLLFAVVFIQALAGIGQYGVLVMAGNRDNLPPPNAFSARSKRLVDNLRENLWFFVPLILIANAVGVSNSWTLLGAQVFLFARVAHALVYLAGWPLIRPLFWLAGVVACGMLFFAILGILI